MLFHTHILLGVVLFLLIKDLFVGGNQVLFFFLVLLGSILPDIDSKDSKINRWSGVIGTVVAFFFKHRGLFHSLILHVILFFVVSYFFGTYYASGLMIGYFAHLLGDGFTRGGIAVFYPFSKFKVRGPVRVGGFFEGLIMVALFFLIVWQFF